MRNTYKLFLLVDYEWCYKPSHSSACGAKFYSGSMTSNTTTTSTVTETINSMDYNTGRQYSATGSGVSASGNLVPTGSGSTNTTTLH